MDPQTLLPFENSSSSYCLLSSRGRFHVFESSHPSFHRTLFFESLSNVFVASVPCLRVAASIVSSYRTLRGTAVSSLRHFYVFVSSALPFVDCATYLTAVLKSTFPAFVRTRPAYKVEFDWIYHCSVTSHDLNRGLLSVENLSVRLWLMVSFTNLSLFCRGSWYVEHFPRIGKNWR